MQRSKGRRSVPLAMRWVTVVAVLLFIPLLIAQQGAIQKDPPQTTGAPANSGPPPKAVFTETKHTFGEVQRGEVLTHTFTVKNEGKSDLLISKVSPG